MDPIARMHRHVAEAAKSYATGSKRLPVPPAGQHLWRWFWDLNATRTFSTKGPNPISYSEIGSYAQLTGTPLRPVDVAGIRLVDREFMLAALAAHTAGSAEKQSAEILKRAQAVSPQAFDAVFT